MAVRMILKKTWIVLFLIAMAADLVEATPYNIIFDFRSEELSYTIRKNVSETSIICASVFCG